MATLPTNVPEDLEYPSRGESYATFNTKANLFAQRLAQEVSPAINENASFVNDQAAAAAQSETNAQASANAASASAALATASASYAGEWSTLTGALSIPSSVSHNRSLWVLSTNLADVTLSEPGSLNLDWVEMPSIIKQVAIANNVSVEKVNYLAALLTLSGEQYLYDAVIEKTYYSPVALTGTLSNVGTDVNGVRTITVGGNPYVIKYTSAAEIESRITTNEAAIASNASRITANESAIADLFDGQQSGVVVFQTYALLDAYTPADATEQKGSFKVTNDPDSSLNGYYSWVSDTTYTKDADLVVNTVDENNTSDAISGAAVYSTYGLLPVHNYYDNATMDTADEGINNLGVVGANAGWSLARIPVEESTEYTIYHSDGAYSPNQVGVLGFYDALGNQLSFVDMSTLPVSSGLNGRVFTTPTGCAEIWTNSVVLTHDYTTTLQVELGSEATTYKAYSACVVSLSGRELKDSKTELIAVENKNNIAAINKNTGKATILSVTTDHATDIKVDVVFDMQGIAYSIGDDFSIDYKVTSDSALILSSGVRAFQSDAQTPKDTSGTQYLFSSTGAFSSPASYFSYSNTFTSESLRYLHCYLELTIDNSTVDIAFLLSEMVLIVNGTPINENVGYGIYQETSGDYIEALTYTNETIITGELLDAEVKAAVAEIKAQSSLEGKKLVTIGDSMVKGHTLASTLVWDSLIATRNSMQLVNYGVNGTKLAVDDPTYGASVLTRYSAMDNDADFVIVFAGTNDAASVDPLGVATDSFAAGQETFNGALNDLCDGLITKYPAQKIGFITPYARNANYQSYVDAIKERCSAHGIAVFDNINNGGVLWTNAAQVAALTLGDSYHLNAEGMIYVSSKYEAFLRSL